MDILDKKSFDDHLLFLFIVQCHDIDNANRLFSSIINKSNYTYAAMFKGYYCFYIFLTIEH
jgi:hypothetical protein